MIHVLVVESHQHVLETAHFFLRRTQRRLLLQQQGFSWSMLHFDAHPDLACPHDTIPAAACFQPRQTWPAVEERKGSSSQEYDNNSSAVVNNTAATEQEPKDLYDLLDSSSSGIAEWILPLVLAANLRHVQWVRPVKRQAVQVPPQLPLGWHHYHVGAWIPNNNPSTVDRVVVVEPLPVTSFLDLPVSALVRVDWDCPYYQDDDTSVPTASLLFPAPLNLHVSELSVDQQQQQQQEQEESAVLQPWMLDICLDYFACLNPFVTDLEQLDPAFCEAFCESVLQSTFYNQTVANDPHGNHTRDPKELATFRQLLSQELQRASNEISATAAAASYEFDHYFKPLLVYYESPELGQQLLQSLFTCLKATSVADPARLTALAVEALPNLTMPHDSSHCQQAAATAMEAIQPSLQAVRDRIWYEQQQRKRQGPQGPPTDPFLITICRSSLDGFTPASVVEDLQTSVLQMIHDLYCGCGCPLTAPFQPEDRAIRVDTGGGSSCRINLVFDYGPWEGSEFEL